MRSWHLWLAALTLCLTTGVVAVYLFRTKAPTEEEAVKMIRDRGGYYSYQDVRSPITEVNLAKKQVSDVDLKALRGLKHLAVLNLEDTQVTDLGLKELKELKELSRLNLDGTLVTDAGMKELLSLENLTSLDLHRTKVTYPGLRVLASLPRLTELKLPHESLTDATLLALAEVDLLHTLRRASTSPGDRRPANASEVRALHLTNCREVTDRGLTVLEKLPNLVGLYLSNTGVTDAGMKHVGKRTKLTRLDLSSTRVTPQGLRELRELTKLDELYLPDDHLTEESLDVLMELGLLHAVPQAIRPEGGRPHSTDAIRALNLQKCIVTSRGLKRLKKLPKLVALDLRGTRLSDYELETVRELKQIESLDVSYTGVSDKGLKIVKELEHLTHLQIFGTQVTDAGLKELQSHTRLRYLGVDGYRVTDRSLKYLADAGLVHALCLATNSLSFRPKNELEVYRLNLYSTQVTGTGVKELKNLKQLKELRLNPRNVTDATMKTLSKLGVLHAWDRTHPEGPPFGEPWSEKWSRPKTADEIWILNLYDCNVTNLCLKEVAALKKLKSLNLCNTHVTEVGLLDFPGLTKLDSLAVNQGAVTNRLLKRFTDVGRLHVLEGLVYEPGWPQPKSDAEVRYINLSGTSATDTILKDVCRLKGLVKLKLNEEQLNDRALKILAEMSLLHTLDRAQAESETRPKNTHEIHTLNLQGCKVSDASLTLLAALRSLRSMDLRNTQVTEAGLKKLRAAMPDCELVR